jgi:hypothetical protein
VRHHEQHAQIGAPGCIGWGDLKETVALVERQDVRRDGPADACDDFLRSPGIESSDLIVGRYGASCGGIKRHCPCRPQAPENPIRLRADCRAFTKRKGALACRAVTRVQKGYQERYSTR